jgi:hypothetical protein
MVKNGSAREPSVRELLAKIEQIEFEERVREEVERRLEQEREQPQAEERRQAEERMRGVKRSQLTAKQKSDIIATRGVDFYNSVEW